MTIVVVPYDPAWADDFEAAASALRDAFGAAAVAIHHIGSTSIRGLAAKPIVDLLVEATTLADVDDAAPAIERLGYEAMGAYGIDGRRYFRRTRADGTRTHHVHAFVAGSEQARRHLRFRDYLRAHPDRAAAYGAMKQQLAAAHADDPEAYMDGKDAFIRAIDADAAAWAPSDAGRA